MYEIPLITKYEEIKVSIATTNMHQSGNWFVASNAYANNWKKIYALNTFHTT